MEYVYLLGTHLGDETMLTVLASLLVIPAIKHMSKGPEIQTSEEILAEFEKEDNELSQDKGV